MFRAHNPRWSFEPLSGDGAARHGGRFNAPGTSALYTSLRMETAWREAQQGFAFKPRPLLICAYEVLCSQVVDLTDKSSTVEADELACPWEDLLAQGLVPPSWRVAQTLQADGVAAIIVPSFAPGALGSDRNMVFWRWTEPACRVAVIDPDRSLPRDGRSWTATPGA